MLDLSLIHILRIADNQLIKEEAALENKGGSVQETI